MDKINPIISLVLAILIGALSWFLQMNYQQQKDINKLLFEKIGKVKDCQDKAIMDFEKRLTLIEYMLRTKNGRFQ